MVNISYKVQHYISNEKKTQKVCMELFSSSEIEWCKFSAEIFHIFNFSLF